MVATIKIIDSLYLLFTSKSCINQAYSLLMWEPEKDIVEKGKIKIWTPSLRKLITDATQRRPRQNKALSTSHVGILLARPKTCSSPHAVHQDDPFFITRQTWTQDFQTRLTVVYVASHFKRNQSFHITKLRRRGQSLRFRGPLKWPETLQVDPGKQFMGSVSKEMK